LFQIEKKIGNTYINNQYELYGILSINPYLGCKERN
jgi:hypothetical protein